MYQEKGHGLELDAHKAAVAKAYGLASAGYDKPALKFFSQGAEALVDFAGLARGQKVLDVATGTGHAALYAGRKVGAERGSVVGIDIAEEMVHLANTHARELSRQHVRFEMMDGENLEFADDEFDVVLCSYGVFFLGLYLAVHVVVRYAAPDADPYLPARTSLDARSDPSRRRGSGGATSR